MPPAEVRKLRPTEIASILGLDLIAAVTAVPLVEFADTADAPLVMERGPREGQRLRVVG